MPTHRLRAALVVLSFIGLGLALLADYANSRFGEDGVTLATVYANAGAFVTPKSSPYVPIGEEAAPMRWYELGERAAIQLTFSLGILSALLASAAALTLLRRGYELGAMLAIVCGCGTAAIWDVRYGLAYGILMLGMGAYARFGT